MNILEIVGFVMKMLNLELLNIFELYDIYLKNISIKSHHLLNLTIFEIFNDKYV